MDIFVPATDAMCDIGTKRMAPTSMLSKESAAMNGGGCGCGRNAANGLSGLSGLSGGRFRRRSAVKKTRRIRKNTKGKKSKKGKKTRRC